MELLHTSIVTGSVVTGSVDKWHERSKYHQLYAKLPLATVQLRTHKAEMELLLSGGKFKMKNW